MQWWRAFAVACGRVLMVPAAISLASLGCAEDSETCKDCDQPLTGTGGASEASATGGAAVTPGTGGAPAVDASAGTGGVLSAAGGDTSSGAGGTSAASATGGASVTPATGGAPVADAGASSGGVPGAAGASTSLTGGSPATGLERCSQVDGPTAESWVAQGAVLLDVRTAEEYAGGHAQDALNIPVEELSGRIGELPTDRAIIVYCRSGNRSSQANALLCDQGFDVYDLGAYSNWTGA